MKEHLFELVLRDPKRTLTKQEWKATHRYLRMLRERIELNALKDMNDLIVYGEAKIFTPN